MSDNRPEMTDNGLAANGLVGEVIGGDKWNAVMLKRALKSATDLIDSLSADGLIPGETKEAWFNSQTRAEWLKLCGPNQTRGGPPADTSG